MMLLPLVAMGCVSVPMSSDIAMDLTALDASGLRGPADGKRAVHYEYCVPADKRYLAEVGTIDPTSQAMKGSRGRIGCAENEWLITGNTHQPGFRQVLDRLAALPYVSRIAEAYFE